MNRFREASRMVDAGHRAVLDAELSGGGWKSLTETEIAGIAALAMRQRRKRMGMVVHRRQRDCKRLPDRASRLCLYPAVPEGTEGGRASDGGSSRDIPARARGPFS